MMYHHSHCPICESPDLPPFIACKDYTVSHETFQLIKCKSCGLVLTNPRPDDANLPAYYQSENYISHSNKSPGAIHQIYKIARHFTLRWKYNIVKNYSRQKPKTLLDIGCGTGAFLKTCQEKNISITGVEPSPKASTEARHLTQANILADLSDVSGTFDAITLWHVLEHLPNITQTIDYLRDRITENGTMFIAVPNLQSHDAKIYGKYWAGYDVPRHLWHFSQKTMQRIFSDHHLTLVKTLPMKLDAYYVSLLSEKYKNGHHGVHNMARAIKTGWISNRKAKTSSDFSSLIYIVQK